MQNILIHFINLLQIFLIPSYRCQMRKRKQGNCFGTARLDVIKKSIESKAPHCHEPNDKSSKIHNFYKIVRIECEKLPTQLHKYKFEEMAEDFCAKEGIERKEISFSTIESSCAKRAKRFTNSENEKSFENMQATIEKYKDKHTEEKFKTKSKLCPMCGKNIIGQLEQHIARVHEGKKPCLCIVCGSSFFRDADLRTHVEQVHEKVRHFKCTLCESSFFKRTGLEKHTKAVHEGKKPFKCSLCDLAFGYKTSLKGHVEGVHEKKKPFTCSECDKSFTQKFHLQRHIDSVHGGKKAFTCSQCDAAFSEKNGLTKHTASVHERRRPYLCSDCGSGFSVNSHLQTHISAVHKKEKPFACTKCSAMFSSKQKVRRHIATVHDGIKPKSKASEK